MNRVLAGALAILAGLIVTLCMLGLWLGQGEAANIWGWLALMAAITLPLLGGAIGLGLLLLERLAAGRQWPRAPVLGAGAVLIPLLAGLVVGLPLLLSAPFDPAARAEAQSLLVYAAAAILPCFAACALYATLTRRPPR